MNSTFQVGSTDDGWQKAIHLEEVWGTVVVLEARAELLPINAETVMQEASAFLHQVDDWFSTYRVDTPISALRMGFADLVQMPEVVAQVLEQCEQIKKLTDGVFDPWVVPGGVDPSGYVKGWAADVAADFLVDGGLSNVNVNAAGDVSCRGFQAPGEPWLVGIQDPFNKDGILAMAAIFNSAIATSGEYERGKHIINPSTRNRDLALISATVIGPDGGLADALATALLIEGTDGARWFEQLPDWSALLIDTENAFTFGPAFKTEEG